MFTANNDNGSGDDADIGVIAVVVDVVALAAADITDTLGFRNFSLGDGKT